MPKRFIYIITFQIWFLIPKFHYKNKVEKFKYAKIEVQFSNFWKREKEDKRPLVFKFEVARIGHK